MRYHKNIGFPKSIVIPKKKLLLVYTHHAIEKYKNGDIYPIVTHLKIELKDVIEVRTKDNVKCTSLLVRKKLDKRRDLTLSIKPFEKYAVVITVWVNNKKDKHKTLDRSKYDLPDNYNSKEIDYIYAGI